MGNVRVTLNNDLNGIEIRFDEKPGELTTESLKNNGFRWSPKQKMWYAKQNNERIKFANNLCSDFCTVTNNTETTPTYDLWELTRIADDITNVDKKLDCKSIAAIVRKHLRDRFPMCKFSVRSDSSEISVDLLESPFENGSEELKAIIHYTYKFVDSYNYGDCDPYADYCWKNFYGVYEYNILSWKYVQTENTVEIANIVELFRNRAEQFRIAEEARKEAEFLESMERRESEEIERKKQEAIHKANHEKVEAGVTVSKVDYFILGCFENCKINNVDEADGETKRNCRVSREVRMSAEIYELFSKQLLDDYTFVAGMGGSFTDDKRINSMKDYEMMDKDERETVEWYSIDCIAVICDDVLKMVIDPQGYNYPRYVLFPNEDSTKVDTYKSFYGISDGEEYKNKEAAKEIASESVRLIEETCISDTWDNEDFEYYKKSIIEWIENSGFKFDVGVVRAIDDERLKCAMYRILTITDGIQYQFSRSGLTEGQKVTVIKMSDFGGMSISHGIFKSFEFGSYAQYDNAVKFVYRPENKRTDYYAWFHGEVLIYNGWLDVPDNVLYDIFVSNGLTCKKSKYLSCDRKQYDEIMNYFKGIGIIPIINTYKPQF